MGRSSWSRGYVVLFTVLVAIAAGGGALVVLSWPPDDRPAPQAAAPATPVGSSTGASSPLIGGDSVGARPRNIADLVRSGTQTQTPASQLGSPLPTGEPSDPADLIPAAAGR